MKSILGPFVPDPNLNVAVLAMDDRLCIIQRRALHDRGGSATVGVLEFQDVRAYRVRCGGEYADVPPGSWATEMPSSGYLHDIIRCDAQRTPEALAHHKHYVVRDGNHRTVDVVARAAEPRLLPGDIVSELAALASEMAKDLE